MYWCVNRRKSFPVDAFFDEEASVFYEVSVKKPNDSIIFLVPLQAAGHRPCKDMRGTGGGLFHVR